jgi:hypothetical protein
MIATLLTTGLAGCMASVGAPIEGRWVMGESQCFSYAILRTNQDGATITLGDKTVQVTTKKITWAGGGVVTLPAAWSNLELVEKGNAIAVRVDGSGFAMIRSVAVDPNGRLIAMFRKAV